MPAASVAAKVLAAVNPTKPTVVCFLGADPGPIEAAGALPATTLTQAAAIAAALTVSGDYCSPLVEMEEASKALIPLAEAAREQLRPGQRALRGLFTGGTFCYEAQVLLQSLPEPVYSNAPLDKGRKLEAGNWHASTASALPAASTQDAATAHTIIDLGEDEFTQGRLHPMIDPALRNRRIVEEARDPATAVILLDYVLGYGAHPDPAGAQPRRHPRGAARRCRTAGRSCSSHPSAARKPTRSRSASRKRSCAPQASSSCRIMRRLHGWPG